MKERIMNNWTLIRGLYLLMGIMISIQSFLDHQWIGLIFGTYFASMGLFAFGCASGNCIGGSCTTESQINNKNNLQEMDANEINTK